MKHQERHREKDDNAGIRRMKLDVLVTGRTVSNAEFSRKIRTLPIYNIPGFSNFVNAPMSKSP